MLIVDKVKWFGAVGFVLCHRAGSDKVTAYVGTDRYQCSTLRIANTGERITKQHAEAVFGELDNYDEW